MVANAKVFLLVGTLFIGINFFQLERGLTDAAPVKDPAITPAHHKAFDGAGVEEETANGAGDTDDEINERGARGTGDEDETGNGARDTDDETNERGARAAGANHKHKHKGGGAQINVHN
ncbi:uncharacterized protein LOC124164275 [Ischnura elegans]|uniref:uncharacterized protein LOC124164275 n=1 Tax=Ischnura elegans TaxID=197161 RepID=UPI001ED87C25|nr:uncharacterized protein LOC124164275 [Ischnura elegans]